VLSGLTSADGWSRLAVAMLDVDSVIKSDQRFASRQISPISHFALLCLLRRAACSSASS
jgi:hypothetical protein